MTISQTSLTTGNNPIRNERQLQRAEGFVRRVQMLLHEGIIDAERAKRELLRHTDLCMHIQPEYIQHLIATAQAADFALS